MRRPRIVQLPISNGYHVVSLKRAFDSMGIKSECWELSSGFDGMVADLRIYQHSDGLLKRELRRLLALRYVFCFDIVIFNFGTSLFSPKPKAGLLRSIGAVNQIWSGFAATVINTYFTLMQLVELNLLRVMRRKIIVVYHGDDARQTDTFHRVFGWNYGALLDDTEDTQESNELKRSQIATLAKFASAQVVLTPDLLPMVPGSVWIPAAVLSSVPDSVRERAYSSPVIVGHAPSNRKIKGTEFVEKAVLSASKKVEGLDFRLLEGIRHDDVLASLEEIDVLIDQVKIGWYGVLAVEAALSGAAVIVHLNQKMLRFAEDSPYFEQIPFIQADVEDLTERIIQYQDLTRKQKSQLSRESKKFAMTMHKPERVASAYLQLLGIEPPMLVKLTEVTSWS